MSEEYLDMFKEEYESNKEQHQEENKEYEEIKALVLSDLQELYRELLKIDTYLNQRGNTISPQLRKDKTRLTVGKIIDMEFTYESTSAYPYFIHVKADELFYDIRVNYIKGVIVYSDDETQEGYPDFIKESYPAIGIAEQKHNIDDVKTKIVKYVARTLAYNKESVDAKLDRENSIARIEAARSLRNRM